MKSIETQRAGVGPKIPGFSLLELLAVVAIVGLLAGIILPALARAKSKAQGTFCQNNTRQLLLGWTLYADDHNGLLIYNLGVGNGTVAEPDMSTNWVNNVLDWGLSPDNTNTAKLSATGLGPYLNKVASAYHCPSDGVASAAQKSAGWSRRVRSYSMNAMVGDAGNLSLSGTNLNNPDYVQFFKLSSLSAIPGASEIFVFLDEHPDTITDGHFLNLPDRTEWQRLPASYHEGAASFAFADGHSEMHRWRSDSTRPPARAGAAQPLPIEIAQQVERADYYWMISRMSIERPRWLSEEGR